MPVSYYNGQKSKYRITLELDVHDDFNPRDINWSKVSQINEDETVEAYIEELDIPDNW